MSEKVIAHIDMDAFFASIEQRDNPFYRGKPVIVGADPEGGEGRGVVSSCSYEARKFGVRSAQPISQAFRRCPEGIFLPANMSKYQEASQEIFEILRRFTSEVEQVSIDEAFLDISGSLILFGGLHEIGKKIKSTIKEETGLTASLGIAPNKMAAKIASGLEKPDGLVIVTEKQLLNFLHPLPVEKLWGVGEKTRQILKQLGIKTIGDLSQWKGEDLVKIFGKNGYRLWELSRGIDRREVETAKEIKSMGKEVTFEKDTADKEEIEGALLQLSEKVSRELRKEGLGGRTITLKIRLKDFTTFTKAKTIPEPTNFTNIIYQKAKKLLEDFELREKKVRLVGVKVSNLESSSRQLSLFKDEKKEKLYQAVDKIKNKFGEEIIHLGGKYFEKSK